MTDSMISFKNMSFAYGHNTIYNSFYLDIYKNDITFIMGLNGCGKTTLLKIMSAFLSVNAGEVIVNDKNLDEYNSKSLSRVLSYVPQINNLNSDFLVKDYLALGRTPYKNLFESINDKDYEIVEKYSINAGIESLLDRTFNTLSGGQKQTVAICRAIVQETPIIVFDEPMSALDLGKQVEFLEMLLHLKRNGKTIVLTSHNPNHALALQDECSVCLIHEKRLLGQGRCLDVLTKSTLERVYGNKIKLNASCNVVSFNIELKS